MTLTAADVTVIDDAAAVVAATAAVVDVDAIGLAFFDCFFFLSLAFRLFSSCCQTVKR